MYMLYTHITSYFTYTYSVVILQTYAHAQVHNYINICMYIMTYAHIMIVLLYHMFIIIYMIHCCTTNSIIHSHWSTSHTIPTLPINVSPLPRSHRQKPTRKTSSLGLSSSCYLSVHTLSTLPSSPCIVQSSVRTGVTHRACDLLLSIQARIIGPSKHAVNLSFQTLSQNMLTCHNYPSLSLLFNLDYLTQTKTHLPAVQPFSQRSKQQTTRVFGSSRNGVNVPWEVARYGYTEVIHKPPAGDTVLHIWLPALDPLKHIHCGAYQVKHPYKPNPYEVWRPKLSDFREKNRRYGRDAVEFHEKLKTLAKEQFMLDTGEHGGRVEGGTGERGRVVGSGGGGDWRIGSVGGDRSSVSGGTASGVQDKVRPELEPPADHVAYPDDGYLCDQKGKLSEGIVVPWKTMNYGLGAERSNDCPMVVVTAPKNHLVQKWEKSTFLNRQQRGETSEYQWVQRCYRLHEIRRTLRRKVRKAKHVHGYRDRKRKKQKKKRLDEL
eukprot:GHVQ01008341.1.p1 GENE.GHVQ01008341.1~~GHVQ01008341.1.p1  ORF type:complete len:491 (-),score=61.68 GHVQ01008341.1:890-2362(-)